MLDVKTNLDHMNLQLERDAGRYMDCRERLNFCPLGACALAGTGLPIDRFMTADALGFTAPMRNRYEPNSKVLVTFADTFMDYALPAFSWIS